MYRRTHAILALILLTAGVQAGRLVHQLAAHGGGHCHAAGAHDGVRCGASHPDDQRPSVPCSPAHSHCDTCDWLALSTGPISDPPIVVAIAEERVGDSPIVSAAAPALGVPDATRARPPPAA